MGAWASVAGVVLLIYGRPPDSGDRPAARQRSVLWLSRAAILSLVLGMAVGVGLALASLAPSSAVGAAAAFLAGGLFVIGAASTVMVGVLEVLHVVETRDTIGPTKTRS